CYVELYDRKAAGAPFEPIAVDEPKKPLTRNGTSKSGQHNLSAGVGETKPAAVDADPNGAAFVNAPSHLESALAFVEVLEKSVGSQAGTHVTAFEVHLRMKKYFLALKSINQLRAIEADHPALVPMVVRISAALDADASFAAPMKAALKAQLVKAFGEVPSIAATVADHDTLLPFALAGARGLVSLGGKERVAQAKQMAMQAAAERFGDSRTLENLVAARDLLARIGALESERLAFAAEARKVFPLATCF
ncbi:N-alpha-acetyltransferase 15, NatA auxiliary subunit, partial [Coemansia sp. RSA 1285]